MAHPAAAGVPGVRHKGTGPGVSVTVAVLMTSVGEGASVSVGGWVAVEVGTGVNVGLGNGVDVLAGCGGANSQATNKINARHSAIGLD